jgi:hypothetical protein
VCCSCVESGETSVHGTPEAYLGNVSGGPSDAILGAHRWGERKMVINVVNFMVIFTILMVILMVMNHIITIYPHCCGEFHGD